ncbi:MAG: sugar transferase [bacterium]|nr:sugar transferase [bacterium]
MPALAIAFPVAMANLLRFRSLRKVFFKQERVGRGGRFFVLWKFRTLADKIDAQGNQLTDQERTNQLGRFLRNTHLDELPQMFNVLCGDMGFIGPRPEMVSIHLWACRRIPGFASRLVIRPGITGLAQVTQGYTCQEVEGYERKLDLDHDYILSRSLLFDLRILAMTGIWMLRGKGWRWKEQSMASKAAVLRALPTELGPTTALDPSERRAA